MERAPSLLTRDPPPSHLPRVPGSLDEMDLSEGFVADLMLRRLYMQGHGSLQSLADALKLNFPVVTEVFQKLREQKLFEITGMDGSNYRFHLTSGGRALAADRFAVNQYAGPCPVSLRDYNRVVRSQSPNVQVDRKSLREALSDLVLSDGILDQVGPSLVSQRSVFLYGPTGNGKTSLAERFLRVYRDTVLVPYAVEVDGQVILVYDPVVHKRVAPDSPGADPRWVVCQRPSVLVGGELDAKMLELQLEESTRIYAAPVQMKANNGVLVIDDFGRQVLPPEYLLNRWIVPLDRRVDYLSLCYGVKFEVPFEMLVVFATNLQPSDLADDAFFRRIPNKIFVEPVGEREFSEIFRRVVAERELTSTQGADSYLASQCRERNNGSLAACHPRDVVDIVVSLHRYEGTTPVVDPPSLERAVDIYFTRDGVTQSGGVTRLAAAGEAYSSARTAQLGLL